MTASPNDWSPREVCAACRRPVVVCYCAHVSALRTETRVVILQHPRERDVPVNTVRIAALCLPDAEVAVGVSWPEPPAVIPTDRPAILLYPGPGALDVEEEPPEGPVTLVVLDGTWSQAKKLLKVNPWLGKLPRYAFRPNAPSDYRIRKEPHVDCVSTIEALVHMLGVLERDPARIGAMLEPFRAMVDAQVAYAKARPGPPRIKRVRRPRAPTDPRLRIPAMFRERAQDLVVVYGEANAWPYGAAERAANPDELVQWLACRIATGETFHAVVAPRNELCPATPFHTKLTEGELRGGLTPQALADEWAAFLRPTDVVCAWGHYPKELFVQLGGLLSEAQLDLRRAARLYAISSVGTMTDCRERLGLVREDLPGAGRAPGRLADAVALARYFSLPT